MKTALISAIEDMAQLESADKQQVQGGKLYTMVHTRIETFRKHFGENACIETEIIDCDLERVCMKATISIRDNDKWNVIGTGFAEEFRARGKVNATSALENCETSCIGRALANVGIHGGEFASSFEVDNAINNKAKAPDLTKGYNIIGSQGTVIANLPTPDTFYPAFRVMVSDPEDKTHRDIYAKNKETVHKALKAAGQEKLESTEKGLTAMVAAYE